MILNLYSVRLPKPAVVIAMVAAMTLPAITYGMNVGAGWTSSDVGLHENGEGLYLSVGNEIPLPNTFLDASFSFDYVQKKGSQPTQFYDPVRGFPVDDAEVTLHVIQPSVFLGTKLFDLPVVPRLYTGCSIGLKLAESWSDFPGVMDPAYGYKETDMVFHLGLSLSKGPVGLDLRWSKSMTGQLIIDPQLVALDTPAKASDLMPGVTVPEEGHKTEVVQLGVTFSF